MAGYRYNRFIQFIKPPSPSYNINTKKIYTLLKNFNKQHKVLDLGCGNRRLTEFVINYDLEKAPDIDIVGDAQELPFSSNKFDFIICQALIEHVKTPTKVVVEVYRILKNDGFVFFEIPFLQGYHADPHDYTRFTLKGMENLFNHFKKIESGTCVGPFSVLAWWLRKIPTIFFSNQKLTNLLEFIFGWLTFWVKYFDLLTTNFKNAHVLAGGLFYIGKK